MLHRKRYSSVNGTHLRSLRLSRGWTQAEFGRRAGYSERLIRKAEAGGNLFLDTIDDLASALTNDDVIITGESLVIGQETVGREPSCGCSDSTSRNQ